MMIELAINGGELVKFCKRMEMPLTATHDLTGPNLKNVGDLVVAFRNAIAHSATTNSKNYPDRNFRFSMNVFVGAAPNAINIEGHALGEKYSDDVAIGFGPYLIYYIRHMCYLHNYSVCVFENTAGASKQGSLRKVDHPGLFGLI